MQVAGDIGEGLVALHERGIVHRDLKPHNVLLTGQGRGKVSDMGHCKRLLDQQASFHSLGAGAPSHIPSVLSGQLNACVKFGGGWGLGGEKECPFCDPWHCPSCQPLLSLTEHRSIYSLQQPVLFTNPYTPSIPVVGEL